MRGGLGVQGALSGRLQWAVHQAGPRGQVPEHPSCCEVGSCIFHKAPQGIPMCGQVEDVRGFLQGPRNEVRPLHSDRGQRVPRRYRRPRGCLGRWRRGTDSSQGRQRD